MKHLEAIVTAFDEGYLAGSKDTKVLLMEVKRQLEKLIEQALRKEEYDSLVHARQILRRIYGNTRKT